MQTYSQSNTDLLFERAQELKAQGINPYPPSFVRTHWLYEINEEYEGVGYDYEGETVALRLCGRVMDIREAGQAIFVSIEDRDSRLQLVLDPSYIEGERIADFGARVYRGDYLGFEAAYIYRKRGRITACITQWYFLALCMLPLPRHIDDPAKQYDQRHVHLAAKIDVRERFVIRSKVLRHVRYFLEQKYGFLEVSTPITPPAQSTGEASSFATGIEAANSPAPLQGSVQSYLRRLLVGGLERVYEITQDFSSEPSSWQNYPQSQVMQCCMMLATFDDLLKITERLMGFVTQQLNATRMIPWKSLEEMLALAQEREQMAADIDYLQEPKSELSPDDMLIDLVPPWSRRSANELVRDVTRINFSAIADVDTAIDLARQAGVNVTEPTMFKTVEAVLSETLKQVVAPTLIQPTFVVDAPCEQSASAEQGCASSKSSRSFQLYINGLVFAEGSTGQTDPQAYCGEAQDDAWLKVLSYGLPPFGEITVSIDRLAMLMTGATDIRDVIYFPVFHRPK